MAIKVLNSNSKKEVAATGLTESDKKILTDLFPKLKVRTHMGVISVRMDTDLKTPAFKLREAGWKMERNRGNDIDSFYHKNHNLRIHISPVGGKTRVSLMTEDMAKRLN